MIQKKEVEITYKRTEMLTLLGVSAVITFIISLFVGF